MATGPEYMYIVYTHSVGFSYSFDNRPVSEGQCFIYSTNLHLCNINHEINNLLGSPIERDSLNERFAVRIEFGQLSRCRVQVVALTLTCCKKWPKVVRRWHSWRGKRRRRPPQTSPGDDKGRSQDEQKGDTVWSDLSLVRWIALTLTISVKKDDYY